jgi:hypothetical protein
MDDCITTLLQTLASNPSRTPESLDSLLQIHSLPPATSDVISLCLRQRLFSLDSPILDPTDILDVALYITNHHPTIDSSLVHILLEDILETLSGSTIFPLTA